MICKAFQVNFSLKNINNRYNQGWNIATIYPTVGIMNTGIAHILSYFPLPQTFVKELGKLAYLVQISNYSFSVFSMEQKTSSSKSQSKSFRAKLWIYVIRKNKSTVMSIWNENGSIILTNINVSIQFCVRSPSWWQSVWRWRSQQQAAASQPATSYLIFDDGNLNIGLATCHYDLLTSLYCCLVHIIYSVLVLILKIYPLESLSVQTKEIGWTYTIICVPDNLSINVFVTSLPSSSPRTRAVSVSPVICYCQTK